MSNTPTSPAASRPTAAGTRRGGGAPTAAASSGSQPGALLLDPEDKVFGVYALDIVDETVATIWSVVNPEKLRHLGPVSDLGGQGGV